MSNYDNIKAHGFDRLTADERRALASKAGKASGKARAQKRDLKKALENLLNSNFEIDGQTLAGSDAISLSLMKQALEGNVKAFEVVRSTTGQDPVQKIAIADIPDATINEIENAVFNQD